MRTRTTRSSDPVIAAFEELLDGPMGVSIIGAEAYWLEDQAGDRIGAEHDRTDAPFAQALALVNAGADPDNLSVWARLAHGERYRVGSGLILVDMAEGAAGIPGRPRVCTDRRTIESSRRRRGSPATGETHSQ